MGEFLMPSLGADMAEGTLLEWCVTPGETVKKGDIVAVVDTDKAEIEIEVFEDGVVGDLLVDVGEKVPVGTPLATIHPPGAAAERVPAGAEARAPAAAPRPPAEEPPAAPRAAPPPPAPREPVPATAPSASPNGDHGHRHRISPLARRVAADLGVDPASVHGTGPGGAVVRADVEEAAASAGTVAEASPPSPAPTAPSPAPRAPSDRQAAMRRTIGDLMARSAREIPAYHLRTTIDLSAALDWLAERNAPLPPPERAIPAAVLLAATARAVHAVPQLNGFFVDGAPQAAEQIHLGVALALRGGGLVAPALHDADRLGLGDLMAALRDLAARARAGTLRGAEMRDPTITVTNLGDRGADEVHGVIAPPQVALVGFGAIRERPWAADGMVGARPTVVATLAADHRATDGHDGSRFLAEIDRLLQNPTELS